MVLNISPRRWGKTTPRAAPNLLFETLDGRNRAMIIAESLARVIAAIRIA